MAIIKTVRNHTPQFGENCFLADNAVIIGEVTSRLLSRIENLNSNDDVACRSQNGKRNKKSDAVFSTQRHRSCCFLAADVCWLVLYSSDLLVH